jgi:hypothetical protein
MTEPADSQMINQPEQTSAVAESKFHTYVGNRIPWYVRLMWLCFWAAAIYYVITYLFPDLQAEIFNPQ